MVTQTLPGVCLVVALVTMVVGAEAFDPTRYRLSRLQDIAESMPKTDRPLVSRDVPIRAKVRYTGQFRALPDDSRRHIAAWAATFEVPEVPLLFQQEVKILEYDMEYWMPVQEVLVSAMRAELKPEEEIEVFVIHIGQVPGRQMFLVNEFLHEGHID